MTTLNNSNTRLSCRVDLLGTVREAIKIMTELVTLSELSISVENRILTIRGQRVIIDADLAVLYAVPTKRLNEQVKRNQTRFPADFMFQLTAEEKAQVVANCDHLQKLKFTKSLPYAFTEHGTIQASNVLGSTQAVVMGLHIVRSFVRLRALLSSHTELAAKLTELEQRTTNNDQAITELVDAVRRLIQPPQAPAGSTRPIGFTAPI